MTGFLRTAALLALLSLGACGGGAGNGGIQLPTPNSLSVADVQRVIAQAVAEAKARNAPATIAVIDRVGNVRGVFRMNGAPATFTFNGARGPTVVGGLEGLSVLPLELASL